MREEVNWENKHAVYYKKEIIEQVKTMCPAYTYMMILITVATLSWGASQAAQW